MKMEDQMESPVLAKWGISENTAAGCDLTHSRCLDYIRESSMHKRAGMEKWPEMLESNSNRYGRREC